MINLKQKNVKNKILIFGIILTILATYVYLFTSARTVNIPLTKEGDVTKFNQEIEFSDSKVLNVLFSRAHEKEKFLEIMVRIENKSNDGTRDFEVEANNYDKKELKVNLVNRKDNYFTYRIYFADEFKEIKVLVFPKFLEKEAETEDVVELVFNKNNTQVGTFEILRTETEFYKLRLNLVWEILLKKEEKNKKKIEVKEKIQSSLLKEIAENKLTSKQKSILNEKEREDKKQKEKELKNNLNEVRKEIKNVRKELTKIEEQIYQIRKNLSQIK
mgnify:FL=1